MGLCRVSGGAEPAVNDGVHASDPPVTDGKLALERETCRSDLARAAAAKTRLESLCRELQKQNRVVKVGCLVIALSSLLPRAIAWPDWQDESRRLANEEQVKRQELSQRFQVCGSPCFGCWCLGSFCAWSQ